MTNKGLMGDVVGYLAGLGFLGGCIGIVIVLGLIAVFCVLPLTCLGTGFLLSTPVP